MYVHNYIKYVPYIVRTCTCMFHALYVHAHVSCMCTCHVQVNGVSVVGHKHQNVVDMIKDSSHVTLTVISKLRAASNGTTSRSKGIH